MESNFSHSKARQTTPDVLPASQYLQERLQERRLRNTRPKKVRQSDFGPRTTNGDDDIFFNEAQEGTGKGFESSPLTVNSRRESEIGGSNARKRPPGVKDMSEQMDRLTKQNFALKLELDHRREHTTKLQEQIDSMRTQVERAEQLEQEHAELLRINTQLVEELEKRDKAVFEATEIICDLEDRVGELEDRNSATRPSTANADSGYAGTETQEQVPPSSPPEPARQSKSNNVAQRQPPPAASAATGRLINAVNGATPARPRREPHILSQKKPSTHALRSVYLETAQALHPVQSFNSLLTRRESKLEDEEAVLDSPRLSVLSESSFPSIYSPKDQVSPDRYAWENGAEGGVAIPRGPNVHLRQDSIKRVSQWMDDRDDAPAETPSKSTNISQRLPQLMVDTDAVSPSRRRPVDTSQFASLAKTLSNTSSTTQTSDDMSKAVSYIKPYPIRTDRAALLKRPDLGVRPTSFAGPMFGEPLLPPTPDSASTRMLRGSRSSIIADEDRSLLDTTPMAVRGYEALEPGIRTAPRQFRLSLELRSAHESLVQRQNDDIYQSVEDGGSIDALPDTVRDLDGEGNYDDFPDGSSLLTGTPSRFFQPARSPSPTTTPRTSNTMFQIDSALRNSSATARGAPRRRQSSSETTLRPRKPDLNRAETTPNALLSNGYNVDGRKSSAASSAQSTIVATRSSYGRETSPANSAYNDTIPNNPTPTTNHPPSTRPTLGSRPRTSPSPARTLSQKAQGLFSRAIGGNGNTNTQSRDTPSRESYYSAAEQREQREKSPLPTLTSTPSSAYVNDIPKEARRPVSRTGDYAGAMGRHGMGSSSSSVVVGNGIGNGGNRRRDPTSPPPYPPSSSRRLSSTADDVEREPQRGQGSFFTRRNSFKSGGEGAFSASVGAGSRPAPVTPGVDANGVVGIRPGMQKRRGSLREVVGGAVAGRRPWR